MKNFPFLFIIIFVVGCATIPDAPLNTTLSTTDAEYEKLLQQGTLALSKRNFKEAIEKYFDPIIDHYEKYYSDNTKRVYSSRGPTETLNYLFIAAANKQDAIVVSQLWAEAFYLKGYANIDLGRIEEAKIWINKAIALSPTNSSYLSELGHIHHIERNWTEALGIFKQAEEYAVIYSPDSVKKTEQLRAMRGVGYSLIELGKLEDAEQKFMQCLEIDANDQKSKAEIEYICMLRKKYIDGKSNFS